MVIMMRQHLLFLLVFLCIDIHSAIDVSSYYEPGPPQLELLLIHLVNNERKVMGLPEFTIDAALSDIARSHSIKMADEGKISHTFPEYPPLDERLARANIFFHAAAENVACGDTSVMELIHEALMESPGHRDNLLSDQYSHLGVGIIFKNDHYYVTQVFADFVTPIPITEMERKLKHDVAVFLPDKIKAAYINDTRLKAFCRQRSADVLAGVTRCTLPEPWSSRKADIYTHTFVKAQNIIPMLYNDLKSGTSSWELGVNLGLSKYSPVKKYAVTLIKFY